MPQTCSGMFAKAWARFSVDGEHGGGARPTCSGSQGASGAPLPRRRPRCRSLICPMCRFKTAGGSHPNPPLRR